MKKRISGFVAMVLFCLCGVTAFAAEEPGLTFDGFLTDLTAALTARSDFLNQADAALTEREKAVQAAQLEWEILERYDSVDFAPQEGEEYLRREYLSGLRQQNSLAEETDDNRFWRSWDAGYLRRAYVLEELLRIYYLDGMPYEVTSRLDEMTGGYAANSTPEVFQLQALLNVDMDGLTGKQTILALKKKQEELGLDVNGVVNGSRVEELIRKLLEKDQKNVIEEANKKLTEINGTYVIQGF